ncbi:MAG: GLPGLI family protein [Saprospiraceae bacterium]|nr:GLPGLI family protein [Saprospiraceae bacterium]
MKLSLLLPAILLFSLPAFAQEHPADMQAGHVRFLVTHNWTKKMAALDYMSEQSRQKAQYMWGSRSEWKEYMEMYFSPGASLYFLSEESPDPDLETYSWKKDAYFIRRDFAGARQSDLLTVTGKTYLVEDSLRCPGWKILNDLKEVAGHVCMSASWVDTVKDQSMVVWFALDIPSGAGPERLCGLPGMILEVDINNGALVVAADKIDFYPVDAGKLALPAKPKGKKISEAEYQSMLVKYIAEKRENQEPWFWGLRY